MRVVNSSAYRKFTSSVNDVHSKLNKSMNKISSGKAYESAAESPLSYYQGKKIDHQYQDTLSKSSLIKDLMSRVDLQAAGAQTVQESLSEAKKQLIFIRSDSSKNNPASVQTIRNDLLQKQQSMVNSLNAQYQNYYIYGGNDVSTTPFSLSADGMTLTFSHVFPGDEKATVMNMELQPDGAYKYSGKDSDGDPMDENATLKKILAGMREQGRVDVGYGSIAERDTLLDTYTGGLNVLTGLSSDTLKALSDTDAINQIKDRMNNSPVGLIGQAIAACNDYVPAMDDPNKNGEFFSKLGTIIDTMTVTEHNVSTVYSDLGNKYALLDSVGEKMDIAKVSLTEQYKDKLGADPYESIMEMYSYQYSYNASLQVGSKLMQSSLFDFMR